MPVTGRTWLTVVKSVARAVAHVFDGKFATLKEAEEAAAKYW